MTAYAELSRFALRDGSIAKRLRTHREVDLRHGDNLHSLGIVIVPSLEDDEIVLTVDHRAAAEASPSPNAAEGYAHRIISSTIVVPVDGREISNAEYLDCGRCGSGVSLTPTELLGLVLRAYGWGASRESRDGSTYYTDVDRRHF